MFKGRIFIRIWKKESKRPIEFINSPEMKPISFINLIISFALFGCQGEVSVESSQRHTRYIAYVGRGIETQFPLEQISMEDRLAIQASMQDDAAPSSRRLDSLKTKVYSPYTLDRFNYLFLEYYLDQLRAAEHHPHYQMLHFNIHDNPQEAVRVYQDIAERDSILLVIDNTWGRHFGPCDSVIKKYGIPVISMNADHNYSQGRDYGNNVLFIGSDDDLASEIAPFIREIVKPKKLVLVGEEKYVYELELVKSLDSLQAPPSVTCLAPAAWMNQQYEKEVRSLLEGVLPNDDSLAVLVVAHGPKAEFLMTQMAIVRPNSHFTFIGTGIIRTQSEAFLEGLVEDGHFLMITQYPGEMFVPKVAADARRVWKTLSETPSDADDLRPRFEKKGLPSRLRKILFAITILHHLPKSEQLDRKEVQKFFQHQIRGNAIEAPLKICGEAEVLTFDDRMVKKREVFFQECDARGCRSSGTQLNAAQKAIPFYRFGVSDIRLYDIDIASNSFAADFMFWIERPSGANPNQSPKNLEKLFLFNNIKSNQSTIELKLQEQVKGRYFALFKVSGVFSHRFKTKAYPFDEHHLQLLISLPFPTHHLRIALANEELSRKAKIEVETNGWQYKTAFPEVHTQIASPDSGIPFPSQGEANLSTYQTLKYDILIQRKLLGPMLSVFVPLLAIGLASLLLLVFGKIEYDALLDPMSGLLLAIIAYTISYYDITPRSGTLSIADCWWLLTFLILIVGYVTIILENSLQIIGRRMIRRMGFWLLVIYLGAAGIVLWMAV